ncbi:hypothetical protein [Coleofasciculus sp. H7-2]
MLEVGLTFRVLLSAIALNSCLTSQSSHRLIVLLILMIPVGN